VARSFVTTPGTRRDCSSPELNRFGITSAIDAAGGFQNFPDNYAAVTELAKHGDLSVRIAYHLFPQVAD
jgi:hypothetical protein